MIVAWMPCQCGFGAAPELCTDVLALCECLGRSVCSQLMSGQRKGPSADGGACCTVGGQVLRTGLGALC
jgi:hypothetical protein